MQSCLGIYIENNIIKYAKLQKDKDNVKVEAYNVAFYENDLENALKKIISETYSYKVPISINVSDEIYNTFEVSALIGKKDTKKAINIEYEVLCSEKGYNKSSLEHKYLIVDEKENLEKQKVLSIIANKNEIAKRLLALDGNKVNTITPITTSIANLVDIDGRQNIAIVNIEEKTKITTIIDGRIYQIDVLEDGMGKILDNINKVENSLSKSYEVCKNMTIYTENSSELYSETNEYMDMVSSTLYSIVEETKKITTNFFSNIDKIYITGLGTCINNIDLYFQDYIPTSKCEILKPYFLNAASMQMPIKDYIEVNSAIALALDGLGLVDKDVDFSKSARTKKNSDSILNQEIDLATIKNGLLNLGGTIKEDFSEPLQRGEKLLIRGMVACLIASGVFVLFSSIIASQLNNKSKELEAATAKTKAELNKIDSDIETISSRAETYQKLVEEITTPKEEVNNNEENNEGITQRVVQKDSIPNLLNRIMYVIPKKVKLTSIKNTTSNHIEIKAEAEKYEQLGYFKAVLSTNGILQNVKSTSGQKNGSVVEVTIEGDLP